MKANSAVYSNCRLTKRGLALITGTVPEQFQKSIDPHGIALTDFLSSHTAFEHLDLIGSVSSDAFMRH